MVDCFGIFGPIFIDNEQLVLSFLFQSVTNVDWVFFIGEDVVASCEPYVPEIRRTEGAPIQSREIMDNKYIDCNDIGVEYLNVGVNCPMSQVLNNPYTNVIDVVFPQDLPGNTTSLPQSPLVVQLSHFNCGGLAVSVCISHKIADGLAVSEIEGPYLDVLARFDRLLGRGTKQWVISPLLPIATINDDDDQNNMIHRHECLKWIDKQETNSILLVSFGTAISLSTEQIKELAIGLEKSQQMLIWIVSDVLLKKGEQFQISKGYEERVQGRGVVVKDWAPQLEILGHSATGGFLTHCGWNSILESVTMGIPLATFHMVFDQPRNAVLITNVLKIGIEVKDWERRDELITSTTIETTIRKLMASSEGNEVRKNMVELGKKVRQSNSVGGDSKKAMNSFIAHFTRS
ncbi:zeatin O-xylosyltransferase-like [Solanum dulcamara]|uniref:zeatin O-xylosyltransferase-like n=1 Tax=Solanum dulcamara TaxID=45834 RepID=UPI002486A80A|nr:zeatin O-xylosyltransferase-like [Solanum dulcamara]